jgi:asparagine N-glycosylation enzyme membrane subunit Stt3
MALLIYLLSYSFILYGSIALAATIFGRGARKNSLKPMILFLPAGIALTYLSNAWAGVLIAIIIATLSFIFFSLIIYKYR